MITPLLQTQHFQSSKRLRWVRHLCALATAYILLLQLATVSDWVHGFLHGYPETSCCAHHPHGGEQGGDGRQESQEQHLCPLSTFSAGFALLLISLVLPAETAARGITHQGRYLAPAPTQWILPHPRGPPSPLPSIA